MVELKEDKEKLSNFKIEKNIEIPEGCGNFSLYPFKDMQVGDSFFVEGGKNKAANVRVSMQYFKKKYGFFFVSRYREEKQNGETVVGVRVWRIEKF